MIKPKNKWIVLRRKAPSVTLAIIGLPQFCITIEHHWNGEYWETAICVLLLAIFIKWGEAANG